MKKITALVLIAVLCLAFASCGKETPEGPAVESVYFGNSEDQSVFAGLSLFSDGRFFFNPNYNEATYSVSLYGTYTEKDGKFDFSIDWEQSGMQYHPGSASLSFTRTDENTVVFHSDESIIPNFKGAGDVVMKLKTVIEP